MMEPFQIIQFVGIIVSIFFFLLGSLFDLKTREVDDEVWLVYAPIGLTLTVLRLLIDPSTLLLTIISIVITTFISLGLAYFGLFGGADAKAIICLGLTIPLVPTSIQSVLGYAHPFFPLVVVISGFICSALLTVWFGVKNLITYVKVGRRIFSGLEGEPRWKKIMACVLGYPTQISKLRSTFYLYPMEEITKENRRIDRHLKLYQNVEVDREPAVSQLSKSLAEAGFDGKVWVTPGIPMLLFILIGLIMTLLLGDIVFSPVLILARG